MLMRLTSSSLIAAAMVGCLLFVSSCSSFVKASSAEERSWKLPSVGVGLVPNGDNGFQISIEFPVEEDHANDLGWSYDANHGGYTNPDEADRFTLIYTNGHLSGFNIRGRPSPLCGEERYTDKGLEFSFLEPGDSIEEDEEEEDDEEFQLYVNGEKYPVTAEEAEDDGWIEGGCQGFMGGSHYYRSDHEEWTDADPIVPIYNKHGIDQDYDGGEMRSMVVYMGNVLLDVNDEGYNPEGYSPKGFDLGGIPLRHDFLCSFNHCSDPYCHARADAITEGFRDATSTIHVFLGYYPTEPTNCQATECDALPCSCCPSPTPGGEAAFCPPDFQNAQPSDIVVPPP